MWQAIIFGTLTASTIKRSVVSHATPPALEKPKIAINLQGENNEEPNAAAAQE
jgi:hypothetical protein